MEPDQPAEITDLLVQVKSGEKPATDQLFPAVYQSLRRLAEEYLARERKGHTLQPTALVHEAYLKLVDQTRVDWRGRTHFFAVGARAMHRILVDYARHRQAAKCGGGRQQLALVEDLLPGQEPDMNVLALHEALETLAQIDPRQAQMVELRFFGGLSVADVAEAMGMSKRTAEREWTMARAWLRRELSKADTA